MPFQPACRGGTHEREVVVFGSGPAGLAVALRLLQKGKDVAIFNSPSRNKPWGGESFTSEIRAPLLTLGCWETFEKAGHTPGYERESAWGGDLQAETSMLNPHGPMWHVDRDRFDEDLRSAVLQRANILRSYRKIDSIVREAGRWRLVLDGGTELIATFLVDATGRSRTLARRLKARVEVHDRLLGFTATVSKGETHADIRSMLIMATPFGWWYATPTPKGHVLVFFTDADLASQELRRHLRPVAANSAFTYLEADQGWLPVGDACASHDPLCGWGVHRAITNGIRAADGIAAFLQNGDSELLEDYRRHCYQQYKRYLDGLAKHYSIERRWPTSPFWERRHRHAKA
jgi:flavin-dependent dehydrogenase